MAYLGSPTGAGKYALSPPIPVGGVKAYDQYQFDLLIVAGLSGGGFPTGVQGLTGPRGLVGATGVPGAIGLTGAPGIMDTGAYIWNTYTGTQPNANIHIDGSVNAGLLTYDTKLEKSQTVPSGYEAIVTHLRAPIGSQIRTMSGASVRMLAPAQALFTGAQGSLGVTGLIGITGIQGPQGNTGIQGQSGSQGNTGVLGQTGVQGQTGSQGFTGSQGLTGASTTGLIGATGSQGLTGISFTGLVGQTGSQGVTGLIGVTGAQGLTGFAATGLQGLTGINGPTGAQGITGFAATGLQGQTGIVGPIGQTGSQGITGKSYTGPVGSTGVQGITGIFGVTGVAGVSVTGVVANAYTKFASDGKIISTTTLESAGVSTFTDKIVVSTPTSDASALRLTDTTIGNGITIGGDTDIYRAGAGLLATDGNFHALGIAAIGSSAPNTSQQLHVQALNNLVGAAQYGLVAECQGSSAATGYIVGAYHYAESIAANFTCANAVATISDSVVKGATSTITNAIGHLIRTQTVGTHNSGLYVESISGGTTNNSIYTNAGLNRFGGTLQIVGSSTPTGEVGVEIDYGGVASTGRIFAYDRGGSLYKNLSIGGTSTFIAYGASAAVDCLSMGGDLSNPEGLIDLRAATNTGVIASFGCTTSVNASYPAYLYMSYVNTINSGYNFNGDGASLEINYVGYQNGTTKFRDFKVHNGKTGSILTITGSTNQSDFTGKITTSVPTSNASAIQITDTTIGNGITIGGDTDIYRGAANLLATDSNFHVLGIMAVGSNSINGSQQFRAQSIENLTGTSQYGAVFENTSSSAATATTIGTYHWAATSAHAYTTGTLASLLADTNSKGAGSVATLNIGVWIKAQTVGGTNYGIRIEATQDNGIYVGDVTSDLVAYSLFTNAGMSSMGGGFEVRNNIGEFYHGINVYGGLTFSTNIAFNSTNGLVLYGNGGATTNVSIADSMSNNIINGFSNGGVPNGSVAVGQNFSTALTLNGVVRMQGTFASSGFPGGYNEVTFTATLNGVSPGVTGAAYYVNIGKLVTLYIPVLTGTSNSATCTITGLPTDILPARTQYFDVSEVLNNSINYTGQIQIGTGGTITVLYRTSLTGGPTSGFTASGNKGIQTIVVTYLLL